MALGLYHDAECQHLATDVADTLVGQEFIFGDEDDIY